MEDKRAPDFEKLYFTLAGKVADAIDVLVEAMREGELKYMQGDEAKIIPIVPPSSRKE